MTREFKDSGIEWIGSIPKDWKVIPHKRVMRKLKEICVSYDGEDIISLATNGIIVRDLTAGGKMPTSFDGYQYVYPGNLLMCLFDIDVTPRCVGYVRNEGLTSPAYSRFEMFKGVFGPYYDYLLRYMDDEKCLLHLSKNLRSSLTEDDFGQIPTILPSFSEQKSIADFLDKKCAEIDSLVDIQEQMIAKLTDYKQSVITETVTKGLDPDVELVPSGIDWIGDYPSHWDIIKIGFIFDNLDYLREPISAELRERNNPQYDYYGASGVIDKIDHYNVDDKVLLIGEDGANLVMRNLPLIYKAEGKFWVNNHAHILRPKKDDYDYLAHALEAANYRNYITGSAQPKLSQENLQAVKLPIPPLSEQHTIAEYLDVKCDEIDALIAAKKQKIEKLKEYKKSVIFEAVTGKIEV